MPAEVLHDHPCDDRRHGSEECIAAPHESDERSFQTLAGCNIYGRRLS